MSNGPDDFEFKSLPLTVNERWDHACEEASANGCLPPLHPLLCDKLHIGCHKCSSALESEHTAVEAKWQWRRSLKNPFLTLWMCRRCQRIEVILVWLKWVGLIAGNVAGAMWLLNHS